MRFEARKTQVDSANELKLGSEVKLNTLDLIGKIVGFKSSTHAIIEINSQSSDLFEAPISDLSLLRKEPEVAVTRAVPIRADSNNLARARISIVDRLTLNKAENRQDISLQRRVLDELAPFRAFIERKSENGLVIYEVNLHNYQKDQALQIMKNSFEIGYYDKNCDRFRLVTGNGKGFLTKKFNQLLETYLIPSEAIVIYANRPYTEVHLDKLK